MTQNIQISKRLDDGTILVIAGDTPDEFAAHASEMVGSGAADLIALFYELVPASANSNTPPPFTPDTPAQSGVDPAVAAALETLKAAGLSPQPASTPAATTSAAGPSCKHGQRVFKSGQSKGKFNPDGTPKEWKMWACPSKNRDDECEPSWVR